MHKNLLWADADKNNEQNEENKACDDTGDDDLSFLSYPPVQVHIFTPGANVTMQTPGTTE